MVKIQKHKAYTHIAKDGRAIEHFKHTLVIPEDAIQDLGWRDGQELSWTVSHNKLVLTLNTTESTNND